MDFLRSIKKGTSALAGKFYRQKENSPDGASHEKKEFAGENEA